MKQDHELGTRDPACTCKAATERSFTYRTATRRPVYNLVSDLDESAESVYDEVDVDSSEEHFANHQFDQPERRRVKPKRKEETVNPKRTAVQRGTLGVRYETARRNEGKMLPTLRMGIVLD